MSACVKALTSMLFVAVALATAAPIGAASAADIREVGGFFVGGHNVTLRGLPTKETTYVAGGASIRSDPNGDYEVGQMYTEYVKLRNPLAAKPILFWHGGGLTGATWGPTPDGRPGWQALAAEAGFDSYVSDAVERGRSGWARYPEIYGGEPLFRSKKESWELFRIGPVGSYRDVDEKEAYPDTRFPTGSFEVFTKQTVPRWVVNDAMTQAAYDQLVQQVCPCTIVAHSSGVPFAIRAAMAAPDKVEAVVAIEAGGVPPEALPPAPPPARTRFLFVYGDHIQDAATARFWKDTYNKVKSLHDMFSASGIRSTWIDLPDLGMSGNSHMLMMDNNNEEIFKIVASWIRNDRPSP